MQGFALALCRVFAVLACFVCASGYTGLSSARAMPAPGEEFCRSADQDEAPIGDFGADSSGGDFAEHDDDDDCGEEPSEPLIHARPEHAAWACNIEHPPLAGVLLESGHRSLDPRPPRQI
jgi:hypothetical protein